MSSAKINTLEEAQNAPTDSDDGYEYEEVPIEDEWSLTEGEEDLEATVKAIQDRAQASAATSTASNTSRPETVDQFLRNFLLQMGMKDTLDCFQTEWNEMIQRGQLDAGRVEVVPDVYIENLRLESDLKNAQRERDEYRQASSAAADTLARVQKTRDFHRLQHKRVVQEKNRLIEDMRKLKVQCDNYEPAVKRINEKYQTVLKQTMLMTRERDKALGQVSRQSTEAPPP
ncbi:sperm-associated antigen 16 protein-like [Sphaeramia orbicularis]|uniref:sperm-associated antigen 16 protein-like n=1 Tax=Sphaeramia orbicularis TaxID=375764 RepID=UPI00117F703F|nr:sperm-associated antigen 16 protein-like [Sphaeramia orbicularis]